jgi:hypothetical protein
MSSGNGTSVLTARLMASVADGVGNGGSDRTARRIRVAGFGYVKSAMAATSRGVGKERRSTRLGLT